MEKPTLLEEFIINKLSAHIEPIRKGIPRGNTIGVSKAKYSAALISTATNLNLKKLAEKLDGSYGVVRVWRTQADFKDCCNNISDEFKLRIDFELAEVFVQLADKFSNGTLSENENLFVRFRDASTYNKKIIRHIEIRLSHYLNEQSNSQVAFFDMAYYLARYSESKVLKERLEQLRGDLRSRLIGEVMLTLQHSELSEQEKGGLISKLKWLDV